MNVSYANNDNIAIDSHEDQRSSHHGEKLTACRHHRRNQLERQEATLIDEPIESYQEVIKFAIAVLNQIERNNYEIALDLALATQIIKRLKKEIARNNAIAESYEKENAQLETKINTFHEEFLQDDLNAPYRILPGWVRRLLEAMEDEILQKK